MRLIRYVRQIKIIISSGIHYRRVQWDREKLQI